MTHHAETLHDAVEEVFRAAGAVVLEEQQRRQGEKYEFDEKTAAAIAREPVNLVAAAVLIATQMAAPKDYAEIAEQLQHASEEWHNGRTTPRAAITAFSRLLEKCHTSLERYEEGSPRAEAPENIH